MIEKVYDEDMSETEGSAWIGVMVIDNGHCAYLYTNYIYYQMSLYIRLID